MGLVLLREETGELAATFGRFKMNNTLLTCDQGNFNEKNSVTSTFPDQDRYDEDLPYNNEEKRERQCMFRDFLHSGLAKNNLLHLVCFVFF